jgi:hypothetical protein
MRSAEIVARRLADWMRGVTPNEVEIGSDLRRESA